MSVAVIAVATTAVSAMVIATESAAVSIRDALAGAGIAAVPSDLSVVVIAAAIGAASDAAH